MSLEVSAVAALGEPGWLAGWQEAFALYVNCVPVPDMA